MDEIQIFDLTDGDFTLEEQYRLALESSFRWLWRTDELDPMDIIKAVRKVLATAMEDS